MIQLTVVVPAYNSQHYLDKCLASLLETNIMNQLEVLIINDGSTDKTADVAQTYVERYPNIFTLVNKENGGHGSGINTAIGLARGRYFKVVDSDDWVITENLAALFTLLSSSSSDVVLAHFHMIDQMTGFEQAFKTEKVPLNKEISMKYWMSFPKTARTCSTFHGIIYRTDFYRQCNIQLTEHIFYEDQEYSTFPFCFAKTILPIDLFVYQYLVGREGQSISHANQVKQLSQIETILWSIYKFYIDHSDMSEEKKVYFQFKMCGVILSYFVAALLKNPNRSEGRVDAKRLYSSIIKRCPILIKQTRKKYYITWLLHLLHVTPDTLEKVKKTKIYYFCKQFI